MSVAASTLDDEAIAVGAPRVLPGLEQRLSRARRLRSLAVATDAVIIVAAAVGTAVAQSVLLPDTAAPLLQASAVVVAASWIIAQSAVSATLTRRGARRATALPILGGAAVALGALAVFSSATDIEPLRLHALVTVPVAAGALAVAGALRQRRHRRHGVGPRIILTGRTTEVVDAIECLRRTPLEGPIVGVVLIDDDRPAVDAPGVRVPNLRHLGDVAQVARTIDADRVVVVGCDRDADVIRRLSWTLEGTATDLVFATRLRDVARGRVAFQHVDGLAMTHVRIPSFDRQTAHAKRILDVVVASLALLPIALLAPVIALAITLDSPGGILFRQRRVGRDGQVFDILKFRTMTVDAEQTQRDLAAHNEGAGPLFKMKRDPRVTRVGRILRRYSLDELPQFWNVLRGDMSVVGPRPPLPSEARTYDDTTHRRLFVQPGITGLWQISGRSDLSWEQSVRLDLHYVENWSVATDLHIIARTAAAMVHPKGAY